MEIRLKSNFSPAGMISHLIFHLSLQLEQRHTRIRLPSSLVQLSASTLASEPQLGHFIGASSLRTFFANVEAAFSTKVSAEGRTLPWSLPSHLSSAYGTCHASNLLAVTVVNPAPTLIRSFDRMDLFVFRHKVASSTMGIRGGRTRPGTGFSSR